MHCDKLMLPEAPVRAKPLSWVFTSASVDSVLPPRRRSLNGIQTAEDKKGCLVRCLICCDRNLASHQALIGLFLQIALVLGGYGGRARVICPHHTLIMLDSGVMLTYLCSTCFVMIEQI